MASRILAELANGPCQLCDLVEALGSTNQLVSAKLGELQGRGMTRRVRIKAWEMCPRVNRKVAVYALGTGRDAKRPEPMTDVQRTAAYRARKKARPPSSIFAMGA